jgi:DNA-binding NtrC family response regulator
MRGFLEAYLRAFPTAQRTPDALPSLEEIKKDYIEYLLDVTARNKAETARILNISRTALYSRLSSLSSP